MVQKRKKEKIERERKKRHIRSTNSPDPAGRDETIKSKQVLSLWPHLLLTLNEP